MTKSKSTKRAMLGSAISLVLCFAMLLGTTFAWFTDSVTSMNNVIKSGNLDIDVEYTLDGENWANLEDAGNLFEDDLWEPGFTKVVALKITNTGSLALKYNANMNIVSETEGTNKAGEKFKLSDYLEVSTLIQQANDGMGIGDITVAAAFMGENSVFYKEAEAFKMSNVLGADQPLEPDDAHYVIFKIDMPETVGNEANHKGEGFEPSINFGINVLATQYTYEKDSFDNQYDKDAEYSDVWDGKTPADLSKTTLEVVPGDKTGTITVNSAADLMYLNELAEEWVSLYSNGQGTNVGSYYEQNGGKGGAYYYDWTWTIKLGADIDLGNKSIKPINVTKWGTFDGQGHTIKNAVIKTDATVENEAGLFNANYCTMKNVTLENIKVTGSNVKNSTAGVLSGSCNSGVDNVTIKNSSVTGGKYTGGVIGYGYTDVTNCTLTNVTVKGGYKLGGVIGYICASNENTGEVTGNTLTDCTVDGIGDGVYAGGKTEYVVGKVVGNYNCNGTCNNNTVNNMNTAATMNIGRIESNVTVNE